ncbi:MAG: hypothetical protein IPG93_10170 [Burkholderiales bacterium]|nr:hypothetical protein [Burkholderiales bacterium]
MNTTERTTLISSFERILDNDDDPVVKLLVMTYEFDDQQLLNMLVQRPLSDRLDPAPAHAAQVADLAPVVIYDARKTRPESALPHFLDLLPVRVGAWRCHHPKAYLVVTHRRVHLLIGSMNLTASGLFANREAFCSFTWHDEALADLHILESFVALLESEYRDFDSASLDAVLASVRSRMGSWPVERSDALSPATLLVANGFESKGGHAHALDQLQAFFRAHFGERQLDALYVVSPFFDKAAGGDFLVGEIEARFGPLPVKEVVTDEAALAALSRAHLGQGGRRAVFAILPEVSPAERRLISQANDGAATEALVLERKLHSKLWILGCGRRRLVYVGSGNFTRKAWCGDNHELGVAWIEDGEAASLWRDIRKDLCCGDADRFGDLAPMPGPLEFPDDDDYVEERGYPDFVKDIELSWHEDVVRFTVRVQLERAADLARFRVDWAGLALTFEAVPGSSEALSQPLRDQLVRARLIGGRNLRFELVEDGTVVHFLPFRHDRALFDRRFEFVHLTADDWMAHCLGRDIDRGSLDPDEHLPEEEPVISPLTRALDDRASNAVIRTQRYLSDFNDVETEFHKRSDEWAAATGSDPVAWELRVGQPLATFARILERTVDDPIDRSFRLGELKLLADELKGPPEGRRQLTSEVLAALRRPRSASPAGDRALPRGLDPYLRFVDGALR